jgi:hypothetical protein
MWVRASARTHSFPKAPLIHIAYFKWLAHGWHPIALRGIMKNRKWKEVVLQTTCY